MYWRLRNILNWKTKRAYNDMSKAMKKDPEYAYGWHCNIACPLMDEGMEHDKANQVAERLMKHLFGINASDYRISFLGPAHSPVVWKCRRCKELVDMDEKRCGCKTSPSPWERYEIEDMTKEESKVATSIKSVRRECDETLDHGRSWKQFCDDVRRRIEIESLVSNMKSERN